MPVHAMSLFLFFLFMFKILAVDDTVFPFQNDALTAVLEIQIKGVRRAEGKLMVCLQNDPNTFLDACMGVETARVHDNTHDFSVIFSDLEPGEYAISIFHDRNDNNKIRQINSI